MHKEGVLDKAKALEAQLKAAGIRVKVDDTDNSPGWKFAQYEMKGVPVRLEIGPKDIEQDQCVLVTRHNREKTFCPLSQLVETVQERLQACMKRHWKTGRTGHMSARAWTRSSRFWKKKAMALSKQCGAVTRLVKTR